MRCQSRPQACGARAGECGKKGRHAERADDWARAKQAGHGRKREGERKKRGERAAGPRVGQSQGGEGNEVSGWF